MDELLPGIDLEMLFEIGAGFRKVRVENFQEIEREFAGVHVGLEIDSVCGRHGVDPCECGIGGGREIFIEALVDCPCCIVAGNNDFFSDLPREEEIELDGNKVLVTHGNYYGVSMDISGVAEEAKSRDCDAVFFGHTHKPVIEEIDGVLAINPGSLSYPRQHGRKPSYVILETDKDRKMSAKIKYL